MVTRTTRSSAAKSGTICESSESVNIDSTKTSQEEEQTVNSPAVFDNNNSNDDNTDNNIESNQSQECVSGNVQPNVEVSPPVHFLPKWAKYNPEWNKYQQQIAEITDRRLISKVPKPPKYIFRSRYFKFTEIENEQTTEVIDFFNSKKIRKSNWSQFSLRVGHLADLYASELKKVYSNDDEPMPPKQKRKVAEIAVYNLPKLEKKFEQFKQRFHEGELTTQDNSVFTTTFSQNSDAVVRILSVCIDAFLILCILNRIYWWIACLLVFPNLVPVLVNLLSLSPKKTNAPELWM